MNGMGFTGRSADVMNPESFDKSEVFVGKSLLFASVPAIVA